MEKIDAKPLGMVAVTLLTRLTAHLERNGQLPRGWTAGELREAAKAVDHNVQFGTDPALHTAFAAALRRVADLSLQVGTTAEDGANGDEMMVTQSARPMNGSGAEVCS